MIVDSLIGLVVGAAVMYFARESGLALLLVPIAVVIGPFLLLARGRKPSIAFLVLYIMVAAILFALMAVTGPGFRNDFDPP